MNGTLVVSLINEKKKTDKVDSFKKLLKMES